MTEPEIFTPLLFLAQPLPEKGNNRLLKKYAYR
jgi:hypothetical protein